MIVAAALGETGKSPHEGQSTRGEWGVPVPRVPDRVGPPAGWCSVSRSAECQGSCPGAAFSPWAAYRRGGHLSAGAGGGPGPSPAALPCGGAPGEGCGRPGSFKKRRRGQAALSGQGSLPVRAPATPWGTPNPLLLPKRCRQVPAGRRVTAGTERTGAASSPVYRRAGPSAAPRSGSLWPCPAPLPAGSRVAPVPPRVAEAKSTKIRMLLTLPSRGVRIRSILSPYRRGRIPAPPAGRLPRQSAA